MAHEKVIPYYHIAPRYVYKIVSHFKSSQNQYTFGELLDAEGQRKGAVNMRGDKLRQSSFSADVPERERYTFISWVTKFHHHEI